LTHAKSKQNTQIYGRHAWRTENKKSYEFSIGTHNHTDRRYKTYLVNVTRAYCW